VNHYVKQWCAEQGYTGKTIIQHRKAFAVLDKWCTSQGLEPTLQAITKRVVRDFLSKWLRVHLKTPATINRYLSAYRTHWAWLIKDERTDTNPWDNTHISTGSDAHEEDHEGKRPFTASEVRALLTGDAPEPLPDLMRSAALTGARIDALCNLRVRDCADGIFHIRKAKREKRARNVPIHSMLKPLVARRIRERRRPTRATT
jgi:integrase